MYSYQTYVDTWQRARRAWMTYQAGVPDARPVEDPGTVLTEAEFYSVVERDTEAMIAAFAIDSAVHVPA